jgi:putative aldouronate transport system permease protein
MLDKQVPLGIICKQSWRRHLQQNYWLYLFLVPGMLYLLIFRYVPMAGIVIAFTDFNNALGIFHSPWVGLKNFNYLFHSKDFYKVLVNSLVISLYRMAAGFSAPIVLALLLNELRNQTFKRSMQTVLYLPHFISWVVVYGIMLNFLSPSTGILNYVMKSMGMQSVSFLTDTRYFRSLVVISDIWKTAGWGTVVYMAAIAGIDPTYYEAAIIDGASRWQRIVHVTLPQISGTIVVMLILCTGSLLSNGFEQIFLMQNSLTLSVSEVFETYTYKVGLLEGRLSFSTAVGLFQSVVGFILIYITNFFAKRTGEEGLW